MIVAKQLVDVVIPTRPNCPYLFEAIESVLTQSIQGINLLVVINGYSRKLEKRCRDYGVTFCNEPRLGAGWARRCGVNQTFSPYIFFLDSDDILLPNAVEICLKNTSSEFELIHGKIKNFSSQLDGLAQRIESNEGYNVPLASNSLVRREAFDTYPFQDFSNTSWLRWIATSRSLGMEINYVDELVSLRRVHSENISRSIRSRSELVDFVVSHHLKRKR